AWSPCSERVARLSHRVGEYRPPAQRIERAQIVIAFKQARATEPLPLWLQACPFAHEDTASRVLNAHTGIIVAIGKGFPPGQASWGDNLHEQETRASAEPYARVLVERCLRKGNDLFRQILQHRASLERDVEPLSGRCSWSGIEFGR